MTTLNEALRPKKPVSHPNAVGYDRVYGNDMSLMERRQAPLTWMTPYYRPESMVVLPNARILDREPLRMGAKMKELRSEEMERFGKRKYKAARDLRHEYTDRIREMYEEEQREAERNKKEFRKRRWWHRQADITLRDPVKALRYNNLFFAPPSLMDAKDIVTLQLSGCGAGDEAMTWVSAFLKQSYTLRRLCLQGNNITAAGCWELVDGIRACKTLTEIDISLNPIKDEGCNSICIALADSGMGKDSRVYSVNMSTCQLTSSSGRYLARLVRENKVIQSLCLWRNELGERVPGERSGVLKILDELVVNTTTALRVLDLTANGIADQDLSEHCRMLETNLRKNRLQDIEKKEVVTRLTRLRKEIAEKKANAVWENEKIEVKRLEKEAASDMARVEMYRRYEERNQTRETRLDDRLVSDVMRHTGGLELNNITRRIRLVLNGNFSIQPTTLARLKEYYDVAPVQNIDLFINMPRRHADLINYRRRVGEPYETRDHTQYDSHNIFKWGGDTYDPATEQERREGIAEWRAAVDDKKERAKAVHFEKFKLNIHGTEEDLRTKKAHVGISVASGVNARVKETLDEATEAGTSEAQLAAARRREEGVEASAAAASGGSGKVVKKVIELEPIIIVERAKEGDAPVHVTQRKGKDGSVVVDVVGGDDMAPEEMAHMMEVARTHDATRDGEVDVKITTRIDKGEQRFVRVAGEEGVQQRSLGGSEGNKNKDDADADDDGDDTPPTASAATAKASGAQHLPIASTNTGATLSSGGGEEDERRASAFKLLRRRADEEQEDEAQRIARLTQARVEARQQEVRQHIGRKSVALIGGGGGGGGLGVVSGDASGSSGPSTPRDARTPRFTILGPVLGEGRVGGLPPRIGSAAASRPAGTNSESNSNTNLLDAGGSCSPTPVGGAPRGSVAWALGGAPSLGGSLRSGSSGSPQMGALARGRNSYIPSDVPPALSRSRRKSAAPPTRPSIDGRSTPLELTEPTSQQPPIVVEEVRNAAFAAFSPAVLTATADDVDGAVPDRTERFVLCIGVLYEAWAEVRRRAEVGSPSEEELDMIAKAEANVAAVKKALTAAIKKGAFTTPIDSEGGGGNNGNGAVVFTNDDHRETVETFIEDLVKETDAVPGNIELFDAVLRAVTAAGSIASPAHLDLPTVINTRGLVGAAACDGSETYLARLLPLATSTDGMDPMEVFCSCYYNGLERIQLTQILLDAMHEGRAEAIVSMLRADEGLLEELSVITQEFFEDVASEKKAFAREKREGKLRLLGSFLDSPIFASVISLEREAADRHTVVSRALFEGDVPLLELLFNTPRYKAKITNPNFVKTDNLSLLMMAVIGNKVDAVRLFLDAFSAGPSPKAGAEAAAGVVDVNLAVRPDVGSAPATALDMAINLGRDEAIIKLLRSRGATLPGDQIAEGKADKGKLSVKVKTRK